MKCVYRVKESDGGPVYGDNYLYGHGCAGGIVGYIDSRNVYMMSMS